MRDHQTNSKRRGSNAQGTPVTGTEKIQMSETIDNTVVVKRDYKYTRSFVYTVVTGKTSRTLTYFVLPG